MPESIFLKLSSFNKSTIIFPEPKMTLLGDFKFLCFKILLKFEDEISFNLLEECGCLNRLFGVKIKILRVSGHRCIYK